MSFEHRIQIAKDQPLLRRKPRRFRRGEHRKRPEVDFWRHFNLEKFAQDWQRGLGKRA